LPALSTVSSRSEWRTFAGTTDERCQLVSFDWPGFGDSYRPATPYVASLLFDALGAALGHLQSTDGGQTTVVAAGHSASASLGLAVE